MRKVALRKLSRYVKPSRFSLLSKILQRHKEGAEVECMQTQTERLACSEHVEDVHSFHPIHTVSHRGEHMCSLLPPESIRWRC